MTFLCCLSALCACTALFGTACNSKGDANATFTVTFETNGGSAVEAQEVKNGQHATKPADPTKSGYTFDNWYADTNFVTLFDFEKVEITANWTIYANWNAGGSGGEVTPDPVNPDPVNPDPTTDVTYTCTNLPDWITNDGCVIFAWVWSPNDTGSWKACEYGTPATSLTFVVSEELSGFLLARCIAGTTQPSWDIHDNSVGRVYNQTANIDCVAGTHSYECASWQEYN